MSHKKIPCLAEDLVLLFILKISVPHHHARQDLMELFAAQNH